MIIYRHIESPVGTLLLAASESGLHAVEFNNNRHSIKRDASWHRGNHQWIDITQQQLDEYFTGNRQRFDLPLVPKGTEFQRVVWMTLASIPYGST